MKKVDDIVHQHLQMSLARKPVVGPFHQTHRDAFCRSGNIISICDPNWAQGLASIGEIAFGLKVQFFLSRVADPPTITVTVAGVPCQGTSGGALNWAYDPGSNAVVFEENGGCMPTPGQEIVIEYDTLCFLE